MRVFVFTDNRVVYESVQAALRESVTTADFFCSERSSVLFQEPIREGEIVPLGLKEAWRDLSDHDLGFSCHSQQIFPAELVRRVRCINIHPGFNPHNRGWYPQVFSLINGLPVGVTIHEMDAEIDHGPIIFQEAVTPTAWDTSATLYDRLLQTEIRLFLDWLPSLLSGNYAVRPPAAEGNYNSRAAFVSACKIDLEKRVTFREAIDFLRAMSHPPYFNAYYDSAAGKVWLRLEIKHERSAVAEETSVS